MNRTETFTDAKSLVTDMQSYNNFKIVPNNSYEGIKSLLATNVCVNRLNSLEFKHDIDYCYSTGIKFAIKKAMDDGTVTYKIEKTDGWNKFGIQDEESKWLTDDFITVKAWYEEQNTEPCTINKFNDYCLIDPKYFDTKRSYKGENSNVYVIVIDLNKLGVMSTEQKQAFRDFMLHDVSNYDYLVNNATVCYIVDQNAIDSDLWNIGLYNLDTDLIIEDHPIIPYDSEDWEKAETYTKILKDFGDDSIQ